MKKIITVVLLLVIVGSVRADFVLKTNGTINICPGIFTESGASVVYTEDDNSITIYDENFLVEKTFTAVSHEYQSGSVVEEAIVTPTGLDAIPESMYGGKNYDSRREWEANSQEEMINKLREQSPYSTLIVFTDAMGNPACYNFDNGMFKYENLFGKKYPTRWYALIDGYVYSINTYDSFYTITYDEASAVWTRKSENITTQQLRSIRNVELQIDCIEGQEVYVTQTLFNNDEKWEYVVREYGPLVFYYDSPSVVFNDNGTITLTRNVRVDTSIIGSAVYNEDGTKLGNLPDFKELYVINGRKYIFNRKYVGDNYNERYEILYEIIGDGNDFDLVEIMRAKSDRRLNAKHGIVTVDINANQAGGEVVISTTDGKVMANRKVGIGQTQINDQPLPTGIYVVSLLKDGHVVESEKYLVQ